MKSSNMEADHVYIWLGAKTTAWKTVKGLWGVKQHDIVLLRETSSLMLRFHSSFSIVSINKFTVQWIRTFANLRTCLQLVRPP